MVPIVRPIKNRHLRCLVPTTQFHHTSVAPVLHSNFVAQNAGLVNEVNTLTSLNATQDNTIHALTDQNQGLQLSNNDLIVQLNNANAALSASEARCMQLE